MSSSGKKGWYVVSVLYGKEKKVVEAVQSLIEDDNVHGIYDVICPIIKKQDTKRNKKVEVEKRPYSRYIFIRMDRNLEAWSIIKSVSGVSTFLGSRSIPSLVPDSQIELMLDVVNEEEINEKQRAIYNLGDKVNICDGPFKSFVGTVTEVDSEKDRLSVSVLIFGRETRVELDFNQVSKV